MEEPGQLVEVTELAKELKVSRQTLSNYLNYLEESFLVQKLYNFSRSRRKVERKLKKYYPAFVSVDLLFKEDPYSRSRVFEWWIIRQLKAEFFWRDPYKNEIDIVYANKEPIPIEIKYGKLDLSGLLAFMRKFKLNQGHIICYQREENQSVNGKKISIIPAYKFLLKEDVL